LVDLTKIEHRLDSEAAICRAIIETPKGSRSKYTYDQELGVFELSGLLPAGMSFPLDFGFIPGTLAEDGDPLDVLVIGDEPSAVGCLAQVKIMGVIEAEQPRRGRPAATIVSLHGSRNRSPMGMRRTSMILASPSSSISVSFSSITTISRARLSRFLASLGPIRQCVCRAVTNQATGAPAIC
jgi:hypothetical protein